MLRFVLNGFRFVLAGAPVKPEPPPKPVILVKVKLAKHEGKESF